MKQKTATTTFNDMQPTTMVHRLEAEKRFQELVSPDGELVSTYANEGEHAVVVRWAKLFTNLSVRTGSITWGEDLMAFDGWDFTQHVAAFQLLFDKPEWLVESLFWLWGQAGVAVDAPYREVFLALPTRVTPLSTSSPNESTNDNVSGKG